ncbi:TOMM precursor leader peptide-binding protein [Spirillospora sp. CA-294931]|uniref:TOMM precursor leader peptide-binding protein n=1 Tax=Spirillospora sp. CA-294931 TaxID=3240042 RepID=UPI003D8F86A2
MPRPVEPLDGCSRPRVRPQFTVIAHDPDIVELREGVWNPYSITLTDASGGGRLLQVIEALDGAATLTEIALQAAVALDDVLDICRRLGAAGALELGASSAIDHYLAASMLDPAGTPAEPRPAVVFGTGDIAAETHRHLRASLDVPVTRFEEPGLWQRLCHGDLTAREGGGLDGERVLEEFRPLEGAFLVAALDAVNPILLRNLNRIAAGLDTPWVHAAPDGPFLLVGPTVVPGRSACYECFEQRVAQNMRENAGYVKYKQALARGKARLGRPLLPTPVLSLAASLVSLEAVNHLVAGSTFTLGSALSVHLPTMAFRYHEVMRLPSCRACVPRRDRARRPPHPDVRSYLNETVQSRNGESL